MAFRNATETQGADFVIIVCLNSRHKLYRYLCQPLGTDEEVSRK
jgi:hypothetical protein